MPPFVIATEAATFEVEAWAPPPAQLLAPTDRTCRVGLQWTPGGTATSDRGCPPTVRAEALATVGGWSVAAPAGLAGSHDLGEIWFVYPSERDASVRTLVRPSHAHHLSLPPEIDTVPYAIRAWSFVRYPAAAFQPGAPEVRCVIEVEVDVHGTATPEANHDCAEPFRSTATDAISQWRFEAPVVGGQAIASAITLSISFVAEAAEIPSNQPPDESVHLWRTRQFESLSREERLWFIRAELLDEEDRDLGPGAVRIELPPRPDLGDRPTPTFFADPHTTRTAPPLPEHAPLFELGAPDQVGVHVYEMALPALTDVPAELWGKRCDVLVQVDTDRHVFAWTEGCEAQVRPLSLQIAESWILTHDRPDAPSHRERFRAGLIFGPDGTVTVALDAEIVRSPLEALPPTIHTAREARPIHRVPPKLPAGLPLPDAECQLDVALNPGGRPIDVEVLSCPDGFHDSAVRAVKRWRWSPAEVDGVAVPVHTIVTIRFSP